MVCIKDNNKRASGLLQRIINVSCLGTPSFLAGDNVHAMLLP